MSVQTIRTEGEEELVVLTRRHYVALLARAGDEAAEDEMTDRMVREAKAARLRDGDRRVPTWLSESVLRGDHPIRAARKHMGLTQADLARRAHITQGHLSDIESGKKGVSGSTATIIAGVLAVDPDWLKD